jgi:hypothetical protein
MHLVDGQHPRRKITIDAIINTIPSHGCGKNDIFLPHISIIVLTVCY